MDSRAVGERTDSQRHVDNGEDTLKSVRPQVRGIRMVSKEVKGQHVLLLSVCMSCLLPALVNAQCGRFKFPTAKLDKGNFMNTVTVPEHQTVTIPFLFSTDHCPGSGDHAFTITVSKWDRNIRIYRDFCKLKVNGSSARSLGGDDVCRSESGKGRYSWTKRVDGNDETFWRLRASHAPLAEATLMLRVSYPPRITEFSKSVARDPVKPGSDVTFTCKYKAGNPDVPPVLTDGQGRELSVQQGRAGEVTHTLHDVSCDDTGRYSCAAPRAVMNRTVMLLVQCPISPKPVQTTVVPLEETSQSPTVTSMTLTSPSVDDDDRGDQNDHDHDDDNDDDDDDEKSGDDGDKTDDDDDDDDGNHDDHDHKSDEDKNAPVDAIVFSAVIVAIIAVVA